MRPTRTVVLMVPALVIACLTACQDGQAKGPLRGATVEVIAYWSAGEMAAFRKVLDLFERQTGAQVRYIPGGDDLNTLLQTRIQGNDPPNVAISPHPGVVTALASANVLKRLDASVTGAVERNYRSFWKDRGTVDGDLYAVYFKANNKSTFWYNHDILAANGLSPPETWTEFVDLCKSLSNLGIPPVAVGAADGFVLTDWFENVYLQTFGPAMYDKLSLHQIPWTDPSVRRTLELLDDVLGQDMLIDGGRQGALQMDFQDSVLRVFGPQAEAAMVYEADFVAGVILNHTEAELGTQARYFRFPTISQHASAVVVGGDAAVALKDDAVTMEFMRFMASPEAASEWARLGGFLSPNSALPPDVYPDDLTRSMADHMVRAEHLRFDMSDLYPQAFGITKVAGVRKGMQDFVANPDDIDGIMQRLEADARRAMG